MWSIQYEVFDNKPKLWLFSEPDPVRTKVAVTGRSVAQVKHFSQVVSDNSYDLDYDIYIKLRKLQIFRRNF